MSTLVVENLQGPSTGTNANTITIPSGQTLDVSGATLNPSPNQIVQVVQYLRSGSSSSDNLGRVDVTSATFVDIFSKSITTTIANSKIRVMVNCNGYNSSTLRGRAQVLRDSTTIIFDPYAWHAAATDMIWWHSDHIDEPSVAAGTTITYKMQANNSSTGTMMYRYSDSAGSTHNSLTLMEIAP